eukprot:SAG31_NODE_7427_length_1691_cov_1.337312_1_plen_172_part_00
MERRAPASNAAELDAEDADLRRFKTARSFEPPQKTKRPEARRRRGSDRNKRMSMPLNAYSGQLAEPSENSATSGSSRGFRRGSDFMQSYLPGTARAVGPHGVGSAFYTDDNDEGADEDAYDFPWWWFVYLCLPSVPGRLFGHALWGVIWPKTISDMAGKAVRVPRTAVLSS